MGCGTLTERHRLKVIKAESAGEPGTAAGRVRIPVPAPGLQRAWRQGAVAENRNLTSLQFALMNIKHNPAVSGLMDPRSLPICKAEENPQMPREG